MTARASMKRRKLAKPHWTRAFCLAMIVVLTMLGPLQTEAAYLVDRLLIAIHQDRTPESTIIEVIPTGSQIEVLSVEGEFARIRTSDGTTGWVATGYVTEQKPAQLRLTELQNSAEKSGSELRAAQATIDALQVQLRETKAAGLQSTQNQQSETLAAQVERQAEASVSLNAELKQALRQNQLLREEAELRELAAKQDAAAEIEVLRTEVAKLKHAREKRHPTIRPSPDLREMQRLAEENKRVKQRLEATIAALTDSQNVQTVDRAIDRQWRVSSGTMWQISALLFGGVLLFSLGALWTDHRSRRRVGGFRF